MMVFSMARLINDIDSSAVMGYANANDKPGFIAEFCRSHYNTEGRVARSMTAMAFKAALGDANEYGNMPLGAYALGADTGTAAFMH